MQDNVFDDNTLSALKRLKNAIEKSSSIAVLTGAGVSVPSGIPDFRSATGLYSTSVGKYRAEDIISHDFFMLRPDDFYAFTRARCAIRTPSRTPCIFFLQGLKRHAK